MSEGNVAAQQLRQFIDRIMRLKEEKRGIGDDIKDVFAEAKAQGYDTKGMRAIITLMEMDPNTRHESEAIIETYKSALGIE